MGWGNVFQVEIDPFCQAVLKKHFPNTARYGDIKEFDGTRYRGSIDILSGGFPCQPYSTAGKRKGTSDKRHLWPEYRRVIGEILPLWVVGENVYGLVNWSGGLVLKQIYADLESEGYETFPPFIIPACGKDAGHKRERVWIIAHLNSTGRDRERSQVKPAQTRQHALSEPYPKATADHNGQRMEGQLQEAVSGFGGIERRQIEQFLTHGFRLADTFEPKLCRTLHGIPFGVDRVKSLGNSVVPQIVYEIFKAIEATPQ